jgi:hypothetical protein
MILSKKGFHLKGNSAWVPKIREAFGDNDLACSINAFGHEDAARKFALS